MTKPKKQYKPWPGGPVSSHCSDNVQGYRVRPPGERKMPIVNSPYHIGISQIFNLTGRECHEYN